MAYSIENKSDAVRQHTVPRFLLENFGITNGKKKKRKQIFSFDKKNANVFKTNVLDATVRNTFYNFDDRQQRISLEPLLGYHEGRSAPIIKKLVHNRDIRTLSLDERKILANFTALQNVRSSNQYEKIKQMPSGMREKLSEKGFSESLLDEIFGENNETDMKDIFLERMLNLEVETELLMQKDWYLLETTIDKPYYISDNPVTLFNQKEFVDRSNLGLALQGIQIYLPISSTLTVAMVCPSITDEFREETSLIKHYIDYRPDLLPIGHNPLDRIKHLNRLIAGRFIIAQPEDLEHLNRLQVSYSEQYIYCQSNKFELASQMLNESPELKKGPRMKFL